MTPDSDALEPYSAEPFIVQQEPELAVSSLTVDTIREAHRQQEEEEEEQNRQNLLAILEQGEAHPVGVAQNRQHEAGRGGGGGASVRRQRPHLDSCQAQSVALSQLARAFHVPGESSPSSDEGIQRRASVRAEIARRTSVPNVPSLAIVSHSRDDQEVAATLTSDTSSDAVLPLSPAGQRRKSSLRLSKKPSQMVPRPTYQMHKKMVAERQREASAVC